MPTNVSGVEITPELIALGERAVRLAEDASSAWREFEEAADADEGSAGYALEKAAETAGEDFARFTDDYSEDA